jgi:hypothetical protein
MGAHCCDPIMNCAKRHVDPLLRSTAGYDVFSLGVCGKAGSGGLATNAHVTLCVDYEPITMMSIQIGKNASYVGLRLD